MEPLKLSAPWTTFYRELCALFEKDKEIGIMYDEKMVIIKVYCSNEEKAEALTMILPMVRYFGNVSMCVQVIPPNEDSAKYGSLINGFVKAEVFYKAFKDNPVFVSAQSIDLDIMSNPMTFVEFDSKPVQFFNDDISSMYGVSTKLLQDVANDIFELNGVFFSTVLLEETSSPLESWMN